MPAPSVLLRSTVTGGSLFLLGLLSSASLLSAQQLSLGAGYTKMEGSIGDARSDHGTIIRLGVDLATRRYVTWSLEGGVERLNEVRRQLTTSCILPGGEFGQCNFDNRSRDTGWSIGTTLRVSPGSGSVRPYGLVGLGFLTVRERSQQVVTTEAGESLPNFSFDGSYNDQALQGHFGAGLTTRPASWPVALYAEGRVTRLFHNYSGGLVADWNPTLVVGVRR